jgi:hypothetical protein
MTPIAAILTFRDNGVTRAVLFADASAAVKSQAAYAEVFGECDIHFVRHSERVTHSGAVPHAQIPLDPEVLVQALRDGV